MHFIQNIVLLHLLNAHLFTDAITSLQLESYQLSRELIVCIIPWCKIIVHFDIPKVVRVLNQAYAHYLRQLIYCDAREVYLRAFSTQRAYWIKNNNLLTMHRDAVDIRPRMSISDALGTMMSFTISSRSLVTVSRLHMTRSLGFRILW